MGTAPITEASTYKYPLSANDRPSGGQIAKDVLLRHIRQGLHGRVPCKLCRDDQENNPATPHQLFDRLHWGHVCLLQALPQQFFLSSLCVHCHIIGGVFRDALCVKTTCDLRRRLPKAKKPKAVFHASYPPNIVHYYQIQFCIFRKEKVSFRVQTFSTNAGRAFHIILVILYIIHFSKTVNIFSL